MATAILLQCWTSVLSERTLNALIAFLIRRSPQRCAFARLSECVNGWQTTLVLEWEGSEREEAQGVLFKERQFQERLLLDASGGVLAKVHQIEFSRT
eukprot:4464295-Amphidinium_carterae.1